MEESVNVLKFAECRASEIFTLVNDVSRKKNKLSLQKVPHHMRRRAASHNPKRIPRSLRNKIDQVAKSPIRHSKKKKCRKFLKEFARRQKSDSMWLPTHIWFAKRFHIQKMWGYKLPVFSNEKRARASYRAATNRVLLQDLSYYCCIELSGTEGKLLSQLSLLTDQSTGMNFASESFLDGTKEGLCYIYHPESFPYRAIGLVSFLWKPMCKEEKNAKPSATLHNNIRQLWIWCHPSFYDELVQVLITIFNLKDLVNLTPISESKHDVEVDCNIPQDMQDYEIPEKITFISKVNYEKVKHTFQKEVVYYSKYVKMMLLKNTLVRHRLVGCMARSLLARVLKPANIISSDSTKLTPSGSNNKSFSCNDKVMKFDEEKITKCDMKQKDAIDVDEKNSKPKLWWEIYYDSEDLKSSYSTKQTLWGHFSDDKSICAIPPRSVIGLTVNDPRLHWLPKRIAKDSQEFAEKEANFVILDELFTSNVADSALWEKKIRDEVTASQLSEDDINKERGKYIISNDLSTASFGQIPVTRIPIIIIQQPGIDNFANGFDVILPQGWSMAFWIPFVLGGAQAAGLRDLYYTNFEASQPTFPISYPDTSSGKQWMEENREENIKRFNRYPKSKRPNFDKLGSTCPFYMSYLTLVNEWIGDFCKSQGSLILPTGIELPSDIIHIVSVSNGNNTDYTSESSEKEMFVLRMHQEIICLKRICEMLNKIQRKHYCSENIQSVRVMYRDLVMFVMHKKEILNSLVLVKIKCIYKGVPTQYSGMYLPNYSDLILQENNPKSFDLIEPYHCSYTVSNFDGKRSHQKRKCFKSENVAEAENLLKGDKKNSIENIRKRIGYISEGGFSYLSGHGCGIGHCVLLGFLALLKNCIDADSCPKVLFREQHSFQYRIASIEVIDNAL